VSGDQPHYRLRITGPAERQLAQLSEAAAAAIVEFMLGTLLDNPHRVGGPLQRELAGLRSARRGAYRIVYEVIDPGHLVVVHRIDHRASVYRPR
jgi:mRNA-degrading endonuclease RelE of RelBE toxin-antitoxin system